MIAKGCDVNLPNKQGMSPLLQACEHSTEIVNMLIAANADILHTDNDRGT